VHRSQGAEPFQRRFAGNVSVLVAGRIGSSRVCKLTRGKLPHF